jgi:Tol biopolymer transport system component
MAIPFDAGKLETIGAPAPVIEQLLSVTGAEATGDGSAQFDLSPSGLLVYRTGTAAQRTSSLVVLDRKGEVVRQFPDAKPFSEPSFSPDGRQVAAEVDGNPPTIWVGDVGSGDMRRLTFSGRASTPSWTPDGKAVTYTVNEAYAEDVQNAAGAAQGSTPPAGRAIYWKNADGSGNENRLWEGKGILYNPVWSPDGRTLYFQAGDSETRYDLLSLRLDGPLRPGVKTTEAAFKVQTRFDDAVPSVSPDGRWVAYMTDETGRWEILLRSADGSEGRWQISDGGGENGRWSRDGTLYFYRGSTLFAVRIGGEGSSPQIARSEKILDLTALENTSVRGFRVFRNFDVSPDGQRFVFVADAPGSRADREHAILVSGWLEELQRLPSSGAARP